MIQFQNFKCNEDFSGDISSLHVKLFVQSEIHAKSKL